MNKRILIIAGIVVVAVAVILGGGFAVKGILESTSTSGPTAGTETGDPALLAPSTVRSKTDLLVTDQPGVATPKAGDPCGDNCMWSLTCVTQGYLTAEAFGMVRVIPNSCQRISAP